MIERPESAKKKFKIIYFPSIISTFFLYFLIYFYFNFFYTFYTFYFLSDFRIPGGWFLFPLKPVAMSRPKSTVRPYGCSRKRVPRESPEPEIESEPQPRKRITAVVPGLVAARTTCTPEPEPRQRTTRSVRSDTFRWPVRRDGDDRAVTDFHRGSPGIRRPRRWRSRQPLPPAASRDVNENAGLPRPSAFGRATLFVRCFARTPKTPITWKKKHNISPPIGKQRNRVLKARARVTRSWETAVDCASWQSHPKPVVTIPKSYRKWNHAALVYLDCVT